MFLLVRLIKLNNLGVCEPTLSLLRSAASGGSGCLGPDTLLQIC